jgi:cytochrome c biogenesis protein CcmG/thiol:disulfide interchange protein DsbE
MDAGPSGSFRSAIGAIGVVLAVFATLAGLPRLFGTRGSTLVGREAPDFNLKVVASGGALEQKSTLLALHELRGRAVVLDFWATWCGPCRAQAPIVDGIARRWSDHGVTVVGVDTDAPDQGDPGQFAVRHGLSYPIVHDVSGETSRAYGVEALPTLVVVSADGRIVAVRTGVTEDSELDRLVREAL